MSERVSILIPVIRPQRVQNCIDAIWENAGVDKDDIEILTAEDTEQIGCPKMLKSLVEQAKFDFICFLGDDCLPQKDFLKNAIREMSYFSGGWGIVGLNDNIRLKGMVKAPAHWLAHRKMLEYLDGEFFHTGYWHCFCDNELMDRAMAIGKYKFCEDAFVYHDHVITDPKKDDEHYRRVYSNKYYIHDLMLYRRRRASAWTFNSGEE